MQKITLKRVSKTGFGVFGVLLDEFNFAFALTAERPDFGNEPNRSCIPEGVYQCKKIVSPKFGHCIQVLDVPNRSHILFHKGNKPLEDSLGCILVGEQFEPLGGQMAVTASRHAFNELMRITDDEFMLDLQDRSE